MEMETYAVYRRCESRYPNSSSGEFYLIDQILARFRSREYSDRES